MQSEDARPVAHAAADPGSPTTAEALYYYVGGVAEDVPGLLRPGPVDRPGQPWALILLPDDATDDAREAAFCRALVRGILRSPYAARLAANIRDANRTDWLDTGLRAMPAPPAQLRPGQARPPDGRRRGHPTFGLEAQAGDTQDGLRDGDG